jgi:hypothetical protein
VSAMHSQKWESDNGQKAIVVLTDRHAAERRSHVRFPLKATAQFSWENPGAGTFWGEGITRDVSGNGAFIFSSTCPPVGAIVRVEILLPRAARGTTFRITATMRLRRLDCAVSSPSDFGFSVEGRMFMARRLLRAMAKIA